MQNRISVAGIAWCSCLVFLLAQCVPKTGKEQVEQVVFQEDSSQAEEHVLETPIISSLEQAMMNAGLVIVRDFHDGIRVQLRYADTQNFLSKVLYDSLSEAYLQEDAARMLAVAQSLLDQEHPGVFLHVWDAARPVRVQQKMWDGLVMPIGEKVKYVSNPKNHSLHNYGCAVDLTLANSSGKLLDMGTDFDCFDTTAWPKYEKYSLSKGWLTEEQVENRRTLRSVMRRAGFSTISSEWWHFNSCTRSFAKAHYAVVR